MSRSLPPGDCGDSKKPSLLAIATSKGYDAGNTVAANRLNAQFYAQEDR
jgi:hypothetical protein